MVSTDLKKYMLMHLFKKILSCTLWKAVVRSGESASPNKGVSELC